MTSYSKLRVLAFGAVIATGCAGVQQAPTAAPTARDPLANMTASESGGRCMAQRTRRQNCLVEALSSSCRTGSNGDDERFYSCVAGGLAVPLASENRQYHVAVSAGDEVFSFRTPGNTVIDVGRLEASAIDANGVGFIFEIERVATYQPQTRLPVEHQELRMNFDGSKSGAWDMVAVTEVYHMMVERAEGNTATVTFETANPRVLARGQQGP